MTKWLRYEKGLINTQWVESIDLVKEVEDEPFVAYAYMANGSTKIKVEVTDHIKMAESLDDAKVRLAAWLH